MISRLAYCPARTTPLPFIKINNFFTSLKFRFVEFERSNQCSLSVLSSCITFEFIARFFTIARYSQSNVRTFDRRLTISTIFSNVCSPKTNSRDRDRKNVNFSNFTKPLNNTHEVIITNVTIMFHI